MKITGIDIGEYRQFKNIKFDFTYPKGHKKEGQPLDKVCFIGQSGTGKTTLLNVIWDFAETLGKTEANDPQKLFTSTLSSTIKEIKFSIEVNQSRISFKKSLGIGRFDPAHWEEWFLNQMEEGDKLILNTTNKICIFIKDSISREADAFLFDQKDHPQIFSDFVKTDTQVEIEKNTRENRVNQVGQKKAIPLGDMQSISIWQYLLKGINEYDETTVAHITSIIHNTPKNKVQEELQKWIEGDPRHELAEECLNPILDKFFLKVDTSAKGNIPVTLSTKQGVKIDSSLLSTGTRQILATAIPIYKFDTKDTVILFDEPERSLFPDIQQILIDYYIKLAPDAQFFFATHSPIIASAFEPCERFVLYFDENGEVKYHNGVAPEGDDPNDVLSEDFGMEELMLQPGLDAYDRYRNLFVEIKNENDPDRKKELIVEQAKLGDLYKF